MGTSNCLLPLLVAAVVLLQGCWSWKYNDEDYKKYKLQPNGYGRYWSTWGKAIYYHQGHPERTRKGQKIDKLAPWKCSTHDWDKDQYCVCKDDEKLIRIKTERNANDKDRKFTLTCAPMDFTMERNGKQKDVIKREQFGNLWPGVNRKPTDWKEKKKEREDKRYVGSMWVPTKSESTPKDWMNYEKAQWTEYDKTFNIQAPNYIVEQNQYMLEGFKSEHSNRKEDRKFSFQFSSWEGLMLTTNRKDDCHWYKTELTEDFELDIGWCHGIREIFSSHTYKKNNNKIEDRVYHFKLCKIVESWRMHTGIKRHELEGVQCPPELAQRRTKGSKGGTNSTIAGGLDVSHGTVVQRALKMVKDNQVDAFNMCKNKIPGVCDRMDTAYCIEFPAACFCAMNPAQCCDEYQEEMCSNWGIGMGTPFCRSWKYSNDAPLCSCWHDPENCCEYYPEQCANADTVFCKEYPNDYVWRVDGQFDEVTSGCPAPIIKKKRQAVVRRQQ